MKLRIAIALLAGLALVTGGTSTALAQGLRPIALTAPPDETAATTLDGTNAQAGVVRATTYRTAAGHWVSRGCEPSGPVAIKRDFIMHGNVWTLAAPIYADHGCTTKLFTVTVGGTYRLGGPSKEAVGARLGRFAIGFRQVTPFSQDIADAMNKANCGRTTSRVGYATDILATGCEPLGQQSQTACPVEYDLLKRSGDELFFGERPADQRGLCSPERQATTLTPPLVIS